MTVHKPSQHGEEDFRKILEKIASRREVPAKALLLREEKAGQPAVFLLAGKAQLQHVVQRRAIAIAQAGAGEWLGEPPGDHRRPSGLRAVTLEKCEVLLLDAPAWRSLPAEARCRITEAMAADQAQRLAGAAAIAGELASQKQCLAGQMARATAARRLAVRECRLVMDHIRAMPSLPMFVHKILAALQDEESSAREVAAVAQDDPSLVAQILKTVNSAQYGLPKRVDDFQRAVALLGFDEVRRLVLAIGLEKVFPPTPAFREKQNHMIAVSRLAHDLAARLAQGRIGPISVAAMLHDVGAMALEVMRNEQPQIAPLLSLVSTAESGAALLEAWRLPASIWQTVSNLEIAEYLEPMGIPEACRPEVCLLRVAHACDEYLTNPDETAPPDSLASAYLDVIGAPQQRIPDLVAQALLPSLRQSRFQITSPLLEKK